MIDRIKLRKEYEQETGNHWKMLQSTAQPTVDYTKWLEDRLVKNCSIPDVSTRLLLDKGLEYAYEKAKETHLSEDGVLNVDLEVLQMVAKDYAKHVQHFLNVC